MDTQPATQFTLEGNEVAHIVNMDTNAAAEAHATAAAAAAAAEATPVVQQPDGIHEEDEHQQHHQGHQIHQQHEHHHEPSPMEMGVEAPHHMDHALTAGVAAPALQTMEAAPEEEEVDLEEHPTPTWHTYFFQLQGHQATYGTLDVDPEANPLLFAWVDEQRKLYKLWKNGKEALSQERIVLLDALGFDWEGPQEPNYGAQAEAAAAAANSNVSGTVQDVETFHLRLTQLQQYKADNGHPNVPETYKKDAVLGRWVAQQRASFRKKTLPQDRINAMLEIGFDFTPGDKKIPFETRLEQLMAYKATHGDVNVPRRYTENLGLGEWLYCQKKLYRRWENDQEGGMKENRRKKLLAIGVDFSVEVAKNELDTKDSTVQNDLNIDGSGLDAEEEAANRSTKWDDKFHELRQYKLANGHTNVPRRSKRNPANDALGEWVHFQRRQYRNLLNGRNSTLTIARKKALELLDFQWSRSGGSSMHHHHHHHHHHGSHQDSQPQMTVRDAVQAQILKAHEEGKSAPWDDRFAQLTEYVQRFGNADVPINYAENLSLGSWVFRQRIAYKVWNDERSKKLREETNKAKETEEKPDKHGDEGCKDEPAAVTNNVAINASEGEVKAQVGEEESRAPASEMPVQESEFQIQESHNDTNAPGTSVQTETLGAEAQTDGPGNAPQVSNSEMEMSAGIPIPHTTIEVGVPQTGPETSCVGTNSLEEIPLVAEADKMTQERYDKLVAVGFDFEIKKIPDDFITPDGQEPAILILSKTAEEEERPSVEDNQDVLEINLGEEEILPEVDTPSKQELEIDEMEVSAILEGSGVNSQVPPLEATGPMSVEPQTEDTGVSIAVSTTEKHDTELDPSEQKAVEDQNLVSSENIDGVNSLPPLEMKETIPSPSQDPNTSHSHSVEKTDDIRKEEEISSIASQKPGEIHPDPDLHTEMQLDAQNVDEKNLIPTEEVKNSVITPIQDESNMDREENTMSVESQTAFNEHEHVNGESIDPNVVHTSTVQHIDESVAERGELHSVHTSPKEDNNIEVESSNSKKRQPPNEDVVETNTNNLHTNGAHYTEETTVKSPKSKRRKLSTTVKVEWEERVLELIQYKIRKQNCNVPAKWKPNSGLADWVWRQRDQYRLYRLGQPSTLTTTRIAKLTELGFEFVLHDQNGQTVFHNSTSTSKQDTVATEKVKARKPKPTPTPTKQNTTHKPTPKSRFKEGKWLESLAKVVRYKEEFGSCNVPRKWKRDPTLGEWVHFQRRQFRLKQLGRRNHMTEERIGKLEAVGFEWSRSTPQNYIRLYTEQKGLYEEDEKEETSASGVAMPTAEHMMELTPMEMMDCREQAQQIADVVEQHVQAADQRVQPTHQHAPTEHHVHVGHHVLGNVEGKVEQLHEGLETKHAHIPGGNVHIDTHDMEPLPVGELRNNGEDNGDEIILSV